LAAAVTVGGTAVAVGGTTVGGTAVGGTVVGAIVGGAAVGGIAVGGTAAGFDAHPLAPNAAPAVETASKRLMNTRRLIGCDMMILLAVWACATRWTETAARTDITLL
jgi:hypothetical protein